MLNKIFTMENTRKMFRPEEVERTIFKLKVKGYFNFDANFVIEGRVENLINRSLYRDGKDGILGTDVMLLILGAIDSEKENISDEMNDYLIDYMSDIFKDLANIVARKACITGEFTKEKVAEIFFDDEYKNLDKDSKRIAETLSKYYTGEFITENEYNRKHFDVLQLLPDFIIKY